MVVHKIDRAENNVIMDVPFVNMRRQYILITDLKKVMEYGVMSVPALVVNNKVVSTGKVLKTENVQKLLQKIVSEK